MTAAACGLMLAACGGGGSSGGSGSEGRLQVINFSYPGGGTLLGQPVTLKATATSGLPVTFHSGTPATCTVSGDQLTLVSAGECLVVASQSGGAADGVQWAAADDTSQLFNVLKHAQQMTVPVGVVLRETTLTVTLPATTDAGLPQTFASTSPDVCTVSGSSLTALSTGVCQLTVTAPSDANYAAMTGQAFVPIDTVPPFVVQTKGRTQSVALDAADASGNALSYTSSTPSVCTVTGSELQLLTKGRCSVSMSKSGGGSENLFVSVDPRFFATGFRGDLGRTAEFGEINFGAGVPIAGWCGGASPSWCNLNVNAFSSTFGFDMKPAAQNGWTGSVDGWWSYYFYEIGAPRKQVVGGGSTTYEAQPFDITNEETLFVAMSQNATQFAGGGDLFVRIVTNHFQKKASNNSDCYVTVSAHLHPTTAGPTAYVIPFSEFAVTDKCEIADLPQTEGWMFDWGVSAESKAAALAEIKANGIRSLQFAPGSMNLTRPTPNADGSLPGPTDAGYTVSTDITVYGPITVQ